MAARSPDRVSDEQDRRAGLAMVPVSRETEDRLAIYVERLRHWQPIKNLVAPSTLDHVWTRHIADSAQLPALAPDCVRWVDLGSGAGFPGLVIAIMLTRRPGAMVHLIESNARKCAFLRDVARATAAPAIVHCGRIEAMIPALPADIEVVTSRALASLPELVTFSRSLLDCGAIGLFLSGQQAYPGAVDSLLTESPYRCEAIASRTHAAARILRVTLKGSVARTV